MSSAIRSIEHFSSLLVYTARPTGRPKGAMLGHGNLLHDIESCRRILEAIDHDRFVLVLPMFHSFMLTVCILLPLATPGSIVLVKSRQPVKAVLGEIIAHEGTVLPAMAPVFRALAALPPEIRLPLRLGISGAGPLPSQILRDYPREIEEVLYRFPGIKEAAVVREPDERRSEKGHHIRRGRRIDCSETDTPRLTGSRRLQIQGNSGNERAPSRLPSARPKVKLSRSCSRIVSPSSSRRSSPVRCGRP